MLLATGLQAAPAPTYQLLASIRPMGLLAQELTAGLPVQVDTLLPAGATPHDFALTPGDLNRLRKADRVIWLGPAGEPYLQKLLRDQARTLAWESLPDLLRLPARAALHDHDHKHEHKHDHDHKQGSTDPHIWWSVPNAVLLLRALEQQLAADRPDWQPRLQQQRQQTEQRLLAQLVAQRGQYAMGFKPFLLAHDAFAYLEEDLGLASDAAILLEPEVKPGVRHLLELKKRVRDQNIGCVLTGALVPASLIDKIDTDPPLLRQPIDELGWDYPGNRYSEWLAQAYARIAECVGLTL